METKHNPIETCELKFDSDAWTIEGYGSVFNSVDAQKDTIHPGAFTKTLKNRVRPIYMRYEHLRFITPGKWLHVEEDSKGLAMSGELTKGHSAAIDLRASMKHETVTGLSMGFVIPSGGFEKKADGGRDIYQVHVFEVSPTAAPMELGATIDSFKSEIETLEDLKDAELFLRDSGMFSRSMATAYVSHLKTIIQSDSDAELQEKLRETIAISQLRDVVSKYDLRRLLS